eukprot:GHUV01007761.1.p1 GENE.GHUV01007761.1~~GHUV01007761.1.p1  ORF type:complete len:408 (+),score=71.37 GHUV01007761.1:665-1888(+)
MKQLGIKHYRLSLSWTRIIPDGSRDSPVNPEGVKFYRDLLEGLTTAGIQPMVTLFHWDLPQVLQDKYGGFNSSEVVDDFVYYADVVFRELGQYVKYWITFNEPLVTCTLGFYEGWFPPGWRSGAAGMYRCGHHHLLAHAKAVQLYRQMYRSTQHGKLSMAAAGMWAIPFNASSVEDQKAAERAMIFKWGWFWDPVVFGNYAQEMLDQFPPNLLPRFTPEEQQLLMRSVDYLGINVYTSRYIAAGSAADMPWVESESNATGHPLGQDSDVPWLKVTPEALSGVLRWHTDRYGRIEIRVTENGCPVPGESTKPIPEALEDDFKVDFYNGYLNELCRAVSEYGVDVRGYYAWSLMDNFEWLDGYRPRFGIVYVEYESLERYPKRSALWLAKHFFRSVTGQDAESHESVEL